MVKRTVQLPFQKFKSRTGLQYPRPALLISRLLFIKYKRLVWLHGNVFPVIGIFQIGNKAGCPHKFIRQSKVRLIVAEAAHHQQFVRLGSVPGAVFQRSGINEKLFTVLKGCSYFPYTITGVSFLSAISFL